MDATPQASTNEPGRDGGKLNNRIWGFGMCHSLEPIRIRHFTV